MAVSLPDVSDQVVSPPDTFGPGRFAPWFLDLDVSLPDVSDQDVSPPNIWTKYMFQLKVLSFR